MPAREQGREWVDDLTIINVKVDVSVIPKEQDAHTLLDALVKHAHNQISLHYRLEEQKKKENSKWVSQKHFPAK